MQPLSGVRHSATRFALLLLSLITATCPTRAQKTYRSYTLFHDKDGAIVEKPIFVDFVTDSGQINNTYIRSLSVFRFDSMVFHDDNPDRPEMMGSPIQLHFRHQDDSLLISRYSPEYYAIFVAYHTIRALQYFDTLFAGYLKFENQSKYKDIKVFLGRYANSTPNEYVLTPGMVPSPTLVYHEIGHRAFWLLEDTLRIGPPGEILHMGLLEYFTVSLANHPVVLEGLVPGFLVRDASKDIKYPNDIVTYEDFWPQYYEAYKDSFVVAPAYKKLYEVNLKRMAAWDSIYKVPHVARNVIEAHKSGMIITHPLWQLRSKIGQTKCDKLVKTAIVLIPSLLPKRAEYLREEVEAPDGVARRYDFVQALKVADRKLFGAIHGQLIRSLFIGSGFDLDGHLKPLR
jgi:hypothetical protein